MRLNFNNGGIQYTLVMSPIYPGTGRAEVYCNAVNGNVCVDRAVLPNLNVSNPTIANLYSIDPRRGTTTLVGVYNVTYRLHATFP